MDESTAPAETTYGTFTKGDQTRTAATPGQAVALQFDGWQREDDPGYGLPPRGGSGSGLDAWLAFATTHGVAVPDDPSRDDVIAAVEDAGLIPTE